MLGDSDDFCVDSTTAPTDARGSVRPLYRFGDDRLPDSFWDLVVPEPNSGCWLWIGWLNGPGYGPHRKVYRTLVGPFARRLHLDHLCRTPICCNPDHLEPVTHAENVRRGLRARAADGAEMPWSGRREQTAEYKSFFKEYAAQRYRDRRGADHTPTPHKEHRCGLCGGTGHNRRRCHLERETGAPARAGWRTP